MNNVTNTSPTLQSTAEASVPVRFVTAAALFDGHDAAINIMRRILQSSGAEVIHLAHNRSVAEVVDSAIQEDAQAIAISSYQGGHVEYFQYIVDSLKARGAEHIRVFGGGGGVIVPEEIRQLEAYGVERIYSPQMGQEMGLQGIIDDMIARAKKAFTTHTSNSVLLDQLSQGNRDDLARVITAIEQGNISTEDVAALKQVIDKKTPVLGITGTGGAGKSSLTDEIIRRFRLDSNDAVNIAVIAIDPTRRKTGGALLGDRIRMNAIYSNNIYMRSLATRDTVGEVPEILPAVINAAKLSGFDLIVIETPGIGQGDAGIVPYVDVSMYVMTPEFGAQSQLEKIDMLDFADLVVINKFDRKGSDDAYRDVAKQVQRNRTAFDVMPEEMPVFGSIASKFNDDGVTAAYQGLLRILREHQFISYYSILPVVNRKTSSAKTSIVPAERVRYLAEISDTVRQYKKKVDEQALIAREQQQLQAAQKMLAIDDFSALDDLLLQREEQLLPSSKKLLQQWPAIKEQYSQDSITVALSPTKEIDVVIKRESLAGTKIPKVSLPNYSDAGDLLTWLLKEGLPGSFPYTAGVFPFKREGEDPARMFAGEGDPKRTNTRFKKLSEHSPAKRLSTAFDSVTLYGFDPAVRPDIYGKVGNSGVSVATFQDMKDLFHGFDLCDPLTSVSMTINGPAPTILAFFLNTAIDQQVEKFAKEKGRQPNTDEHQTLKAFALKSVRGTVQADILKEDQGQNTCIFSTEFSLRMMADIQQYFIHQEIRNFYSVSISGYHIAEAGANPLTQLAFTLANGFTYVESYLARGMDIDDFAPNLSFFFSNGMDPEYTVMGRVARRIWAITMRDKYKANSRSQRLKYHIQTSGRSLHAQEMDFNDIRTTLQALIAINDNCNSLHTNAYDEAITTPTEESVRRALAIQLIINNEFGLAKNENPLQGSFIVEELTELVEEAVLREFERLSERGGVLGAMETGFQRGKIQDESLLYEHKKHDGSLPIIGVNTFLPENPHADIEIELARSTTEEKESQIQRVNQWQDTHSEEAKQALQHLQNTIIAGGNGFDALMSAARVCSLGQITDAMFTVGGQYRRSM
ncbi:B12 binding domain / kinase domain / Methylmalonyl-CoA mutase [gamma proteobacterium IMCC1989]|nr:B12 binding domain / kinase domain / Methylmalonyl-CoA mutase [gamma proteobacterium IMCC1989]